MNRALRHTIAAITFGVGVFAIPLNAEAAGCTLMKAPAAKDAALRVYFTKFEKEDKTGGKYRRCRIVRTQEAGTKTFFVTPFRQDANVVVHRGNWPR